MEASAIKTNRSLLVFVIALFYFVAPLESMALVSQFSLPKLLAIVVIVVRIFSSKRIKTKSLKPFIPLLVYAIFTLIWSINVGNTARSILLFLIPSLLVMEAIDVSINTEKEIRIYLWSYVIGAMVTVVVALINREQVISDAVFAGEERLSAMGQDQNAYAFFVNMAVVIILGFYRQIENRLLKMSLLVALIASAFVIASTGSRTGLFVLSLVVALFVFSSSAKNSKLIFVILIIVSITVLLPYLPQQTIERFAESRELISEGDFSRRGVIWGRAFRCFWYENWFLGVGYSNFSEMLAQHYGGWMMASHNTYLTYLIEFGIIGVFTFISALHAIISSTMRIFRIKRNVFIFNYIFPLFITMFLLETEYKRWIFMIAVLLFNYERTLILKKEE